MKKQTQWLLLFYGICSFFLMTIAFAGLFSRKMRLHIPVVTTDIIPALHRHAVWGETLRGKAILVGGEHWFFLLVLGLVISLGIGTAVLNAVMKAK